MQKNELEENEDFAIDENPDIIRSFDQDLRDWIASIEGADDNSYQATLYKYEHPKHGTRKEYVFQWNDEIPTLHDIGTMYGGGRYQLIVHFPEPVKGQRKVRGYKFRIHSSYDKNQVNQAPAPVIYQGNGGGNGNGFKESLSLMREVIAVLLPIMRPPENGGIAGNMQLVNDIVKQSARNQMETYKEIMTQFKTLQMEYDQDEQEEQEQENGILKMIEPLLNQYLPLLLGSGPQSRAAIETVKRLPEFKKTIQSKKDLGELVEYTIKTQGKEKAAALLKKLRIKPESLPAKYKGIFN